MSGIIQSGRFGGGTLPEPSSRLFALAGNSLEYGPGLATPDDPATLYQASFDAGYDIGGVSVQPHDYPWNGGITTSTLISYGPAQDAILQADPTGIATVVADEILNSRLLDVVSLADAISLFQSYCAARRLAGRVEVIPVSMAATNWANPASGAGPAAQAWETTEKHTADTALFDPTSIGVYWDRSPIDLRGDAFVGADDSCTAHEDQYLDVPPQVHLAGLGHARRKALGFTKVCQSLRLDTPPASLIAPDTGALMSYWRLAGTPGSIASSSLIRDGWGNEEGINHLTVIGGSIQQYADYLHFAGGGTAVLKTYNVAVSPSLSYPLSLRPRANVIGVSLWFRATTAASPDPAHLAGVWDFTDDGHTRDYGLFWSHSNSRFEWHVTPDGDGVTANSRSVVSGALSSSTWYWACGWSDGANLYLEIGDEAGSRTTYGPTAIPGAGIHGSNGSFHVGGQFGDAGYTIEGDICGVALLRGEATTGVRAQLYQGGDRTRGIFKALV